MMLPPGWGLSSLVFIIPRAAHCTELKAPTTLTSSMRVSASGVVVLSTSKSTMPALANWR
jgi:hypothetical protein